eukprot:s1470_g18.t1
MARDWCSCHPQVESILKDMFSATRFEMRGIKETTATTRGTRPGDPAADVLFNMAFRLVALDARQRFREASSSVFVGEPAPAMNVLCHRQMPREGFAEVSFVDDIAYVVHSHSPDGLVRSVQIVASCLHDAAHQRGLRLNYGSGKTEAKLRLAGPGPKKAKEVVWHSLGGSLPVVTEHSQQIDATTHGSYHNDQKNDLERELEAAMQPAPAPRKFGLDRMWAETEAAHAGPRELESVLLPNTTAHTAEAPEPEGQ